MIDQDGLIRYFNLYCLTVNGKDKPSAPAIIPEFAEIYPLPGTQVETAIGDGNGKFLTNNA